MADAGADLIVAHMGVTTGGSIGARSSKTLDDCVTRIQDIADAARGVESRRARHLPRRTDLGTARRGVHHHALPRRRRVLRRELGRAPAGRTRHRRADQDVQEHPPAGSARAPRRAFRKGGCPMTARHAGAPLRDVEDGARRAGAVGQALVAVGTDADGHQAPDARARDDAAGHGTSSFTTIRRAKRSSTSSTASPSSGSIARSAGSRPASAPSSRRRSCTRSSTRRRSR